MVNFAHYTLRLNKIDPMSRKSLLERSVINKKWTLKFLAGTKMLRIYSKILMFNILKTVLPFKTISNAYIYISIDMIILL